MRMEARGVFSSLANCGAMQLPALFVTFFLFGMCQQVATAEKTQCEAIETRVAVENQNTVVETTGKRILGTWLSSRCEILPGPEYVLRAYTFKPDGSYKVVQHRYWDDSCSMPKLTLVGHGALRVKRDRLINPDAASGYFKMSNITLTPHDVRSVKELEDLAGSECPGQVFKPWRRYEEHVVYDGSKETSNESLELARTFKSRLFSSKPYHLQFNSNDNIPNNLRPTAIADSMSNINCLGSLKWAFNEMKLLKVQLRPIISNLDAFGQKGDKQMRLELLLGDVHSSAEQRNFYNPTAYGTPLLKYTKEEETIKMAGASYQIKNVCTICATLFSATDKSPPHLLVQPHLPPYIWGEWTSTRCETRPMGLHLTRKFTFYSDASLWVGEHKFFEDSTCSRAKFVVTAAGHFTLTSTSSVVSGATNVDFNIERASLTLFSKRMVHEMRSLNACGHRNWALGVPQELSSSHGCLQMGIVIPSVQREIVRVEMNYEGSCLLYLGQADTDNVPHISNERPTAFQEPLLKCGEVATFTDGLHEMVLDGERYYDNAFNRGKRLCIDPVKLAFIVLMIVILLSAN